MITEAIALLLNEASYAFPVIEGDEAILLKLNDVVAGSIVSFTAQQKKRLLQWTRGASDYIFTKYKVSKKSVVKSIRG